MLDHTGIVVTDLGKARAFYDAIARPLSLATADNFEGSFLLGKGPNDYPYLWIGTLILAARLNRLRALVPIDTC